MQERERDTLVRHLFQIISWCLEIEFQIAILEFKNSSQLRHLIVNKKEPILHSILM